MAGIVLGVSVPFTNQIAMLGDAFDVSFDAIVRNSIVRNVETTLRNQGVRFLEYDDQTSAFIHVTDKEKIQSDIFFAFTDRKKKQKLCSREHAAAVPKVKKSSSVKRSRITDDDKMQQNESDSKKNKTAADASTATYVNLMDEVGGVGAKTAISEFDQIRKLVAQHQREQFLANSPTTITRAALTQQSAQMDVMRLQQQQQQMQRVKVANKLAQQQQEMGFLQTKDVRNFEEVQQLSAQNSATRFSNVGTHHLNLARSRLQHHSTFSAVGGILQQQRQQARILASMAGAFPPAGPAGLALPRAARAGELMLSRQNFQDNEALHLPQQPNLVTPQNALPASHASTYAHFFYQPAASMKDLPSKSTQDMAGWQFFPMNMEQNLKELPLLNEWRIVVSPMSGNPDRSFTIDPSNVLPPPAATTDDNFQL